MAYSNRLYYFGLKVQAAFNTPLAPDVFPRWLDGTSLMPELKVEEIFEGDGGRDASLVFKSAQLYKFKLVFYPRPIELGWILLGMFGSGSDAITGVGPYTHTFTPQDAFRYFTIEGGFNQAALVSAGSPIWRVQDCVFTSMEVEAEANKPVKITCEGMGRKNTRQSTAATVTLESGAPFKFVNGLFTINTTDRSAEVSKLKLSMTHSVDDGIYTNAITPIDFIWTQRKVTAEIETIFANDNDLRRTYFGGVSGTTDSALNGTGALDLKFYQDGDTADTDTVQLLVPNVVYTGKPVDPKLDGKAIRQELACIGVKSGTSVASAVLTNTRATAYS